MERTRLHGGRLSGAAYDDKAQVLEIEFSNGTIKRFKNVPFPVWLQLRAAPNPASYYEDRIEEEYAVEIAERRADPDSRKRLDDLFG